MKCPTDSVTLVMSERAGVEIDYCPECRGVWLDRGELDKILARSEAEFAAHQAPAAGPAQSQNRQPVYGTPSYDSGNGGRDFDRRRDDHDRGYDNRGHGGYDSRDGYRKKKRESWLSELFD